MAVAPVNFPAIITILITLFTNAYVCLCRCPQKESDALLSLNITFTTFGDFPTPWANGTDCCEWTGIDCDEQNNHVVGIYIDSYPYDYGLRGGVISDSLCNLPFLTSIHLEDSGFTGILPSCLGKLLYLQDVNIVENGLSGIIPPALCLLANLTYLRLEGSQLSGSLPSCLNSLSSLNRLYLSNNHFTGQIPRSLGNISSLEVLDVSFNHFSGTLPSSFAGLSSLSELKAHGNAFNESISSSALPTSIESLYLSADHHQVISETLFQNLTKLRSLYLSNCILNFSTTWIPQFQFYRLELVSCQMDGQIPPWISTQFSLTYLTLANNSLAGEIPSWIWDNGASLRELNLSGNHLHGRLFPNGPIDGMSVLDVSGNALNGNMPSVWPPELHILMLNDNLLIGKIPPSLCNLTGLLQLNLAKNKLDGIIPQCLISGLVRVLNLGHNNLEGSVLSGLSDSNGILSLVLRNNKLSGTFPPSITNNTGLQVLDIGHNKFTGHIPKSIGNLSELQVLVTKGNYFSGSIPLEIGQLKKLQILDLSSNNISGSIPHNIVSLQTICVATEDGYLLNNSLVYSRGLLFSSFRSEMDITSKGMYRHYSYILSTFKGIDLSNNQLDGDVPSDFGKLKGLRFLNLSMNKLSGVIPNSLGDMSQLESLDLSTNRVSGIIPSELQSLSYLGYLNLSNNNLSGSIPQGGQMITFENTSYSGNPKLQGCPLPKNCSWPKFTHPPPTNDAEDKNEEQSNEIPWYEIGLGLSHGVGFSGVVLLLAVRKGWRHKYFKRVDKILKFFFPYFRNRRL